VHEGKIPLQNILREIIQGRSLVMWVGQGGFNYFVI